MQDKNKRLKELAGIKENESSFLNGHELAKAVYDAIDKGILVDNLEKINFDKTSLTNKQTQQEFSVVLSRLISKIYR